MKIIKDYIKTLDGYKQYIKERDNILDSVDFDRIAKIMKCDDWCWGTLKDDKGHLERRTPTAQEIRKKTKEMIEYCIDNAESDEYYLSSGGIHIEMMVYNPEDCEGELKTDLENAPDDFEHRVGIRFQFIFEDTLAKY